MAGLSRAIHRVCLVALSGQQYSAQSDPPRYQSAKVSVPKTYSKKAINLVKRRVWTAVFGTLLSANANPSTLESGPKIPG